MHRPRHHGITFWAACCPLQRNTLWYLIFLAAMLLVLSRPVQAGSSFKVGSFTKTTAGAPVSQNVAHGLGETPKALILWTNGKINESFSGDFLFAFGVTDGTTDKSAAVASEDNSGSSDASRRMANKALIVVDWDNTVRAEADLTSWDATNFTLNWTTNNATAYVIHFLAIGGSDISAKVIGWQMPTSTGDISVTGVGFRPNVVIHAHLGHSFIDPVPASDTNGAFGLGVMDASGDQWANYILDDNSESPSDAQRGQQTDACIYSLRKSLEVRKEASWVSMDSDGFTVNFSNANSDASASSRLKIRISFWVEITDTGDPQRRGSHEKEIHCSAHR